MRILAIDPGMYASAVVYCPGFSIECGMRWHFLDVPTVGDVSARPNAIALRDWIMQRSPDVAFIELVGPMPKQGIASTAKFMRATGILEGVVECCGVEMKRITPQRWKKHFKMKVGATKEDSRQLAMNMAPEIKPFLTRKKDHGRAEAALIAIYGSDCLAPIPAI